MSLHLGRTCLDSVLGAVRRFEVLPSTLATFVAASWAVGCSEGAPMHARLLSAIGLLSRMPRLLQRGAGILSSELGSALGSCEIGTVALKKLAWSGQRECVLHRRQSMPQLHHHLLEVDLNLQVSTGQVIMVQLPALVAGWILSLALGCLH